MSLNNRETALISIGVSVGVNCQPCLQVCVANAREIGVTEQEIQDRSMQAKSCEMAR